MKSMKRIIYVVLLILSLAIYYVIHFLAPAIVTEVKHPLTYNSSRPHTSKENTNDLFTKISITSFDGTSLIGYTIPSAAPRVRGTLVFFHGIRSGKGQFLPLALSMSKNGFNCVVMDGRAHGESGGTHCTYGVKEKADASAVLDHVLNDLNYSDNIGVWGMSLGGAVALQCLAHDPRIKFGIVESTFSNFEVVTKLYAERWMGFQWNFLTDYIVNRACIVADFNAADASPVNIATQITQPTLIFHGTADKNIPITEGKKNFSAISSEQKRWIPITNGTHNAMAMADEELYLKELTLFLDLVAN